MTAQLLFAQEMFSGPVISLFGHIEVWAAIVYLAGVFAVAGFRPQQIRHAMFFRVSVIAFALFLIIPITADSMAKGILFMMEGDLEGFASFVRYSGMLLGRLLLAAAVLGALMSFTWPSQAQHAKHEPMPSHPAGQPYEPENPNPYR